MDPEGPDNYTLGLPRCYRWPGTEAELIAFRAATLGRCTCRTEPVCAGHRLWEDPQTADRLLYWRWKFRDERAGRHPHLGSASS